MKFLIPAVLAVVALAIALTGPDRDGVTSHSIATADGDRSYLTYIPPDLGGEPRPVVMLFHGHAGSARGVIDDDGRTPSRQWLTVADREGLILVVPEGLTGSDDKRGWNDCRADAETNPTTDDVAFVDQVLTEVAKDVAIDERAIFAAGLSNGGHFSLRLAIERSDVLAGVAAVAAALPANSECVEPTEPMAVLLLNGTDDPLLPFNGGAMPSGRGRVLGTVESLAVWADLAAAESDGVVMRLPDIDGDDGSTVVRTSYTGTTSVALYAIEGGGHTEPSLTEHHRPLWTRVVGPQNHDMEMAEEIWAFWLEVS